LGFHENSGVRRPRITPTENQKAGVIDGEDSFAMVDRALVAKKLQELRAPIQPFFSQGPAATRSGDFDNWRHDVIRWLRAGRGFTQHESDEFSVIEFRVLGQEYYPEFDTQPTTVDHFRKELQIADGTVKRAIENLELGITAAGAALAPATATPAPLVNVHNEISNSNVLNLNVSQVLEAIAGEIDKADKAEGKRFRDFLKKAAGNPAIQAILKGAIETIFRHHGGSGSGGTISV
jgi:hypothetical protein